MTTGVHGRGPGDAEIRRAELALSVGTWLIVCGAMLYSVLTVTPLMEEHSPKGWEWTAPILPLVVDAAVVIVVRLDSVLARLGGGGGRWPAVLRWMTGIMTVLLNVGASALVGDLVGVAVHAVAPLLLIVTAETGLAYRRAIAAALARREAAAAAAREERERQAAERVRAAREEREAERAAAERREQEAREHAAQLAREQREHEARLAREAAEREERREAAERAAREQAERERERREREREQARIAREHAEREERHRAAERAAREAAEKAAREQAKRERERREREREQGQLEALLSGPPAEERLPEDEARQVVAAAYAHNMSVRSAAQITGWSVGWVSRRYAELREREPIPGQTEIPVGGRR